MGLKNGLFDRSVGAGKVIGRLSHGYVNSQVNNIFGRAYPERDAVVKGIVNELGEYKGLLLKIGQVASYMDFSLSERTCSILADLQDRVKPLHFKDINKVVNSEFGAATDDLFFDFEEKPFAAASVGQVHRAITKLGDEVAVKVQYPKIGKAIKNDLATVRFAQTVLKPFIKGIGLNEVVDEARYLLMNECDYCFEADQQTKLRRIFMTDPEVEIPKVYRHLSGSKVMTSEYFSGQRFGEFKHSASQASKDHAGQVIAKVLLKSSLKHGIFNGDPHPGNYLFGEDKVCFLDFGHVKVWGSDELEKLKMLWKASFDRDQIKWRRAFLELHRTIKSSLYDESYFYHLYVDGLLKPYIEPDFKFTRNFILKYSQSVLKAPLTSFAVPDPAIIVWMRQIFGLNAVLGQLEAKGSFRAIAEKWI